MNAKKAAAAAILAAFVPVWVDVATEPFSDRTIPQAWLSGAWKVGLIGAVAWAVDAIAGES